MARRYFTEEVNIKPGVVSEELRNALGISKKSLPIWIHRMRILGYPPGWLKKADMTNTTIDFINGDDDVEEGQVNNEEKKTYNTDSFYEYPGFNSPVPNGIRDDFEKLGMPPMQAFQQLNYAKKTIQSLQPVPHRLLKYTDVKDKNDGDESSSSGEESSDTDDGNEKSNVTLDTSAESSSAKALDSTINLSSELDETNGEKANDDESSSDSDEIISLDIEKRALCLATPKKKASTTVSSLLVSPILDKSISNTAIKDCTETSEQTIESTNESTTVSTHKTIVELIGDKSDQPTDESIEHKNEERTDDHQEHQDNQAPKIDDDQNDINKAFNKYEEEEEIESASKITLVSMGAPVPASLNGEKPPLENFAVGMGELIYFENLPTSTGVFDKMRKVIKKVRKKLSTSSTKLNVSSSSQ